MADGTLVYDDEMVKIYWTEHQYYLADWRGAFRKGEDLRDVYRKCVDLAKVRRGAPWLIDASQFGVLDPADAKWVAEVFWPDFAKAGVRFQAAIMPAKAIGRMSATRASENLSKQAQLITSNGYATRAEAHAAVMEWLSKKNR